MSKFFQKVATPETQRQQSVAPSGATQDANAHQEAQNDFNTNIGGALMDLVGATAKLGEGIKTYDKAEMARMRSENQLDADADLADLGSFMSTYIDEQEEGKSLSDYEPDELRSSIDDATQAFIKSKNLSDKGYFQILQQDIKAKSGVFFQKQTATNQKKQQAKRYESLKSSTRSTLSVSDDPAEIISDWQDKLDMNVGLETKTIDVDGEMVEVTPSIKDTHENAKVQMFQSVMQEAIENRDPRLLKMMESEEFKDFFDFPDYDNVKGIVRQQVQSTVNKTRQLNYDTVSEQSHAAASTHQFKTAAQASSFLKARWNELPKEYRPDTKQQMRLEAEILKSVATSDVYTSLVSSLKDGDYTVLERGNHKKEITDEVKEMLFTDEVGLGDLSPEGYEIAITSGDVDAEMKSFFDKGYPFPPSMVAWAETKPRGMDGWRRKSNAFRQLIANTQDTSRSAMDLFDAKEYSRTLYVGNLLDDIDAGVLDEGEAQQVLSAFNNDLTKNIDSFGNYTSTKAHEALNDEDVTEWLSDKSSDAPWTYDEFSGQAYMKRQFKNYFSYAMETTDDPAKAMKLADKMFYKKHRAFESPDGSEGVLPQEFLSFASRDFVEVAHQMPELKDAKLAAGYLGLAKDYDFEGNLSFRPDPNYSKNKQMAFYYNNVLAGRMTAKELQDRLTKINKRKLRLAEERNVQTTQNK